MKEIINYIKVEVNHNLLMTVVELMNEVDKIKDDIMILLLKIMRLPILIHWIQSIRVILLNIMEVNIRPNSKRLLV